MKKKPAWTWALAVFLITTMVHCLEAETVSYSYDEAGRLIGVYYDDGRSLTYLYDSAGNLLRKTVATFTDSDGDGMDDAWEMLHFGDLSRDGLGDFDGDGMTDLAEFLAGTDPKDAGSLLRITEVASQTGVSFQIEWASVAGKVYRAQYNDTVQPSGWTNLPGDVTASGTTATKTDATVPASANRFYRVQVLH